jgi:hypothetical protein
MSLAPLTHVLLNAPCDNAIAANRRRSPWGHNDPGLLMRDVYTQSKPRLLSALITSKSNPCGQAVAKHTQRAAKRAGDGNSAKRMLACLDQNSHPTTKCYSLHLSQAVQRPLR